MQKYKSSKIPRIAMWVIVLVVTYIMIHIEHAQPPLRHMQLLIAIFFLTFSIPKIMHLGGFATTFARYDLVARNFLPYGYLYPFIELALGFGYLFNANPVVLNSITLFVLTLTGLGVYLALHDGKVVYSGSMGTVFRARLGWFDLIEIAVMASLATTILWWL